jgi:hypothetical protein
MLKEILRIILNKYILNALGRGPCSDTTRTRPSVEPMCKWLNTMSTNLAIRQIKDIEK